MTRFAPLRLLHREGHAPPLSERAARTEPARRHRGLGLVVIAAALAAAAPSCGGTKANDTEPSKSLEEVGLDAKAGETGLAEAGAPQRGGTLVYGLEAESSGGYCLPEAQLAISGMMVVRAVYDTLTVPNGAGGYSPYLAESVTPSEDHRTWTIEVRDKITFHDGTPLTGEVVKNNLDAYRGAYPSRKPLLFTFVLQDIESVEAKGQTVTVKTKVPWVAFPAFLHLSSRMGIMAQAQLDDTTSCERKLIGTGPFEFDRWEPNSKLVAKRNPDYWQTAPDGKPYPYADAIEFRPLADSQVQLNSIQNDDGVNIMHTANAEQIGNELKDLRDAGKVNMFVSDVGAEVGFVQLNATQAPFDDITMRQALAFGIDRADLNDKLTDGLAVVADGPFAPDSPGYVDDPGFPAYDPVRAEELVAEYVASGGKAAFTLTAVNDPATVRTAELVQQRAAKIGIDVTINRRDQAAAINDLIGRKYQAILTRNYPGGDPDINHVWWYGEDNPVNFGGFDDPAINGLLDEGRSEPDPARRKAIYQDISREFAKQVYNVWSWYTPWAIVEKPEVHGVLGPPLPGADPDEPGPTTTDDPERQPYQGLATGHSLLGLWIDPSG